jgi:two-component system cell cycle response regulator
MGSPSRRSPNPNAGISSVFKKPNPAAAPSRPLRVLVVDDDGDSREMLEEVVVRLGHLSESAADGREALAVQHARPVDVILSDWSMPGMTGIQLCRRLRASQSGGYTYFVLMTAFHDRAHFLEGLRAGADDYLTKPMDVEELELRLRSAARVIAHQKELTESNAALREKSEVSFEAARTDPLTNIANRLRLSEDLEMFRSHAERYGHRFCVALCDIDVFKKYNDTNGHIAGDDVLRCVAATIRRALRQGDNLYRYGGEEFLVILREQDIAQARNAMNRVRSTVESAAIPHEGSPTGVVTISVGLAEIQSAGASNEDWIRPADSALYRAKRKGRNRVESAGSRRVA